MFSGVIVQAVKQRGQADFWASLSNCHTNRRGACDPSNRRHLDWDVELYPAVREHATNFIIKLQTQ